MPHLAPGHPPGVIQGTFMGGRPRLPQPTPASIQARPAAPRPATAARPGAILPASAPRPILPTSPRPAAVQPSGGDAFALPPTFKLRPSHSGQRLPEPVQRKMETFFGADFSDVRVHVGPEASSIGALAFAHGTDLYFAPGQYDPASQHGQRLLGHELTHVVQQRAGRVRNPLGQGIAVVQDPALEAEADRMGLRAASASGPIQAKPAAGKPTFPRPLKPAQVPAPGRSEPARPAILRAATYSPSSGMRPGPSTIQALPTSHKDYQKWKTRTEEGNLKYPTHLMNFETAWAKCKDVGEFISMLRNRDQKGEARKLEASQPVTESNVPYPSKTPVPYPSKTTSSVPSITSSTPKVHVETKEEKLLKTMFHSQLPPTATQVIVPIDPYAGLSPAVKVLAQGIAGWTQAQMGGTQAVMSQQQQAELTQWVLAQVTGGGNQKYAVIIGPGSHGYANQTQYKVIGWAHRNDGTAMTYHITLQNGSYYPNQMPVFHGF
jgi:hypothetical protein